MEEQLSYVSKLSLQEMALRKVAVVSWNGSEVLASIGKFRFRKGEYQKDWRETIERKVADRVSKLQIPELLKKRMMPILKPIGLQILRWKMFHEEYVSNPSENFDVPVLAKLCWTTSGAVDYRKTAEKLVRSHVVNIFQRYVFACLYCLEDYISGLWKELPEWHEMEFYSEDPMPIEGSRLEDYWPYFLQGKESVLDDMFEGIGNTRFYRYAFEYSARKGNKTATEYFFQKLTDEEREATLFLTAQALPTTRNIELYNANRYDDFPKEKVSDVFCYLLSLMTREQQIRIFREQPCEVLRCFLDWPLQDFFLDIADFIWTFLPERDYSSLMWKMTRSIQNSGYYIPNVFQAFFLRSPINFKNHFVARECQFGSFFPQFFDTQDAETLEVIFRNVDAADRVRLVTSEHIFKLFYSSIWRGRWRIVEVCLLEASLSKEGKDRLKEEFMEFLKGVDRGRIRWRKRKWRRFFEYLDGLDARTSKRSLEDETLSKAKKLCCE